VANLYAIIVCIANDEHVVAGIFADETSALAHCAAANVPMEPATDTMLDVMEFATVLHQSKEKVDAVVLTGEEDEDGKDNKEHCLLQSFYSTRGDDEATVCIAKVPLGLWGTKFSND
jgi:hypothetical protein